MKMYAVEIILRQNWSNGMFDVCSFYSCMQELDLFWCLKLSKWSDIFFTKMTKALHW